MSLSKLLNINMLHAAKLENNPYPHLVIPNFLNQDKLVDIVKAFPEIKYRGSVPADSVAVNPEFKNLIDELEGNELRLAIQDKFSINLENKPTMLTLRGNTSFKDGVIHTDSKSKIITLLLYMNLEWDFVGGRLRILKNKNSLDNFSKEVTPMAGTCVIFQVTDNCWHGHTKYSGKRLSLQLNYLTSGRALNKHLNHHRLTAWFKNCFAKFVGKS